MMAPHPDACSLVELMSRAGSELGKQLRASWEMTLGEYLSQLVPSPRELGPHGHKVQTALREHCNHAGIPGGEEWSRALELCPIIQQADHAFLLLDQETLLNNMLFAIAASLHGIHRAVTVQCSSVTCISRWKPLRGSVFLDWSQATYNIFGKSKRFYQNAAFVALPGPVKVMFDALGPEMQPAADDPFLAPYIGQEWSSAVQAFSALNQSLWQACSAGSGCDILIADDRMSYRLIKAHLLDENSPIHRIVFDSSICKAFLKRKRDLIASRLNIGINRPEPDHFWYRPPGRTRLYPIVIGPDAAAAYVDFGSHREPFPVPYHPRDLACAIDDGLLVPDIVLIFLARCILSGIDAIGGPSQQDYVALYQKLLLDTDAIFNILTPAERKTSGRPNASRLGGAPLLEPGPELQQRLDGMSPGCSVASLFLESMDRPVCETIGRLTSAQYLSTHTQAALDRPQV